MTKHLVIPDSHSVPNIGNQRYTWLGELALEERADVIVDIGDWAEMESLCSYDKGKKSFEGRRYKKDVAAARDAREKFDAPIKEHNRKYPKDQYTPRKVATTGNHEDRIDRVQNLHPELDGVISIEDLGAEENGWDRKRFLEPVTIEGITYCHYFTSGVLGRPIGGKSPSVSLLEKLHVSCVQGHIHTRDFAEATRADGRKIAALVAGCYFDHHMGWAGPANKLYWRGAVILNDVREGAYDPHFIGMAAIKKKYS